MYSFMSKLVLSISHSSSHLHPLFTPPFHLPSFSSTTLPFSTYHLHLPFVPSLPSLPLLTPSPLLSSLCHNSSFCREEHEEITSLYLRAAQSFPDEIDLDVQVSVQFICVCVCVCESLLWSYFLLE